MSGEYTDRARLHKAIERCRAADDQRIRVQAVEAALLEKSIAASRAADKAEAALTKARKEEPEMAVAVLLGGATTTAVDRAETALREAQAALDDIDRQRAVLQKAKKTVRDDIDAAHDERSAALAGVLRGYAGELVEQLHEARRRVVSIDFALSAIAQAVAGALPVGWDSQRDYQPDPALAIAWKAAIVALSNDAATPVPVVTTRNNVTHVTRTIVSGRAPVAPGSRLH